MVMTLDVNMISTQMILFFSYSVGTLSVGIFHFCNSRTSKFNSMGFYMLNMTLSNLLIQISFF